MSLITFPARKVGKINEGLYGVKIKEEFPGIYIRARDKGGTGSAIDGGKKNVCMYAWNLNI
ncbi:hypothetical protein FRX31_022991 [Thalictrum thalictroides]|uniref:Uncharacterized protein n=1 Tax=Thalictrum thalictroides TaxID=46969 RepID=A0A7J6VTB1_THATH|nr:hypothetical protein FRX31_022991 [Thalictrum thalictroides]